MRALLHGYRVSLDVIGSAFTSFMDATTENIQALRHTELQDDVRLCLDDRYISLIP